MSTETLPRTDLDSDIADAVNGAFDELECCSQRKDKLPCGGPLRGFQECHTCVQGWLCENHWNYAIEVAMPEWKATFNARGWIGCVHCLNRFTVFKKYIQLTPIPPR